MKSTAKKLHDKTAGAVWVQIQFLRAGSLGTVTPTDRFSLRLEGGIETISPAERVESLMEAAQHLEEAFGYQLAGDIDHRDFLLRTEGNGVLWMVPPSTNK